jgi:hypothetical protein
MKTIFKTEHGSTYEINWDTKTWKQLEAGKDKDPLGLRSIEGPFYSVDDIIVGERVNIWAPPFVEGLTGRLISTSPVAVIVTVIEED